MHIMLSNDDGIFAPGIRALCDAAVKAGHRVSVCAPDRERSAAGHAATLVMPLHIKKVDFPGAANAWAADGTPSDCARLGLYLLKDDPVDAVVTGINRGHNLGGACIYSGTVASAMEASMHGTPSLAVSLCTEKRGDGSDYSHAAKLAMRVLAWMMDRPLPRGAIYSLNVPELPYEEIRGLLPGLMAPVFLDEALYEKDEDEQGECYYYRNGTFPPMDNPDYDFVRINEGYATITKLTWDLRLNADDSDMREIGV